MGSRSSWGMYNDASAGYMAKAADGVAMILTSWCRFATFFKAGRTVITMVKCARRLITNIQSSSSLLPYGLTTMASEFKRRMFIGRFPSRKIGPIAWTAYSDEALYSRR